MISKERLNYIAGAVLVIVVLVFGYLGVKLPIAPPLPEPVPVTQETLSRSAGYVGPCYLNAGGTGLTCGDGGAVTLNSGASLVLASGSSADLPTGSVAWADVNKAGSTLNDLITLSTSKPMTVTNTTVAGWLAIGTGSRVVTTTQGVALLGATVSGVGAFGAGGATTVGAAYATVAGGITNTVTAAGQAATIGGGTLHTASGPAATIGGGAGNTNSGAYATIGGGLSNTASAANATVGGGTTNTASGQAATIGGGTSNLASLQAATVGGGNGNTASNSYSTVGGGDSNTASGPYSTISGGNFAIASVYGQNAYASGGFAVAGDAQTNMFVVRLAAATHVSGTWYTLLPDASSEYLTVPLTTTWTVRSQIVGASPDLAQMWSYEVVCMVSNIAGTTSIQGNGLTVIYESDADYNAQCAADDTNDALAIQVRRTDNTDYDIRWVATIWATQVQYPAP